MPIKYTKVALPTNLGRELSIFKGREVTAKNTVSIANWVISRNGFAESVTNVSAKGILSKQRVNVYQYKDNFLAHKYPSIANIGDIVLQVGLGHFIVVKAQNKEKYGKVED